MIYVLIAIGFGLLALVLFYAYSFSKKHHLGKPSMFVLKTLGVFVVTSILASSLTNLVYFSFPVPYYVWELFEYAAIVAVVWLYWQWELKRATSNPPSDQDISSLVDEKVEL